VWTVTFLLAWLFQSPPSAPLIGLRATLRQLADHLDEHRPTYGAAPEQTRAKHDLRDWVEAELAAAGRDVDTRALNAALHAALRGAGLLCDDCDSNVLGYVDDIRVSRSGDFLVVVTAMGVSCGYDESAYLYTWDGRRWARVWEHEQNTDTPPRYLPQAIHDVQISAPGADGSRLLDFAAYANDGYPPLTGRVLPDDVLFEFTAGGFASGDSHIAVRHFTVDRDAAIQVDPVAVLPHDFVLEWLSAPWTESRSRSESASLEGAHAQLHRADHVGDFPEPTLRCAGGADLWQVGTRLFEGPKRYYRVRWQPGFRFTLVGVSETPYPDCTVPDARGEQYPDILRSILH
jgi:hypothetical protein